ncbi:MAG: hypothetical protein IPP71_09390 [Bacteroidetes bacterium]|nr:hypothetical protein [Bacteroidota bacterium]
MSWKIFGVVLIFLFQTHSLRAQVDKIQKISFVLKYGNLPLKLDTHYALGNGDSIEINTLKFYISELQFFKNDTIVFKEPNSYHLVDAAEENSKQIQFSIPSVTAFHTIRFNLGIDSITNFSGALGGELDPTKGMYWTWQNGYINFKMEGKCNSIANPNKEFQFHLGGYQYPYNSLQTVVLNVSGSEQLFIVMDIEKLISGIDLSYQNQIMSPGKEAMILSEKIYKIFSISKY